jgi:hypothetical protein
MAGSVEDQNTLRVREVVASETLAATLSNPRLLAFSTKFLKNFAIAAMFSCRRVRAA